MAAIVPAEATSRLIVLAHLSGGMFQLSTCDRTSTAPPASLHSIGFSPGDAVDRHAVGHRHDEVARGHEPVGG